jgi:carbonic anhydrase
MSSIQGEDMFKKQFATMLTAAAFVLPALAQAGEHHGGDAAVARAYIKEIQDAGKSYLGAHKSDFFKELSKGQKPRATMVTCSDSRVHTNMLDKTPEGDLFMVRNIGNQLASTMGSVQYGVNHLGSSLLLFIGHSSCGAIKAASGDYSTLEDPIKKELDTINITKGAANIDGVKTNVNNGRRRAREATQVKNGELLVVGTMYDFADDMKQAPASSTSSTSTARPTPPN